jgi:hypothetical protein
MERSLIVALAFGLPILLAACQTEKPPVAVSPSGKTIGSAHLTEEGLLEVMLRAEGDGGMVGDAFFVYKKGTPEYAEMMKHIGGLKRGESKLVPAYP